MFSFSSLRGLFKHSDVIRSRGIDNGFDSLDWEIIAIRR